jgi:probable HAF family extracellular repeat protein
MRRRRWAVVFAGVVALVLGAVEVRAGGMYHVTDLGTPRGIKLNDAGQVTASEYHGSMPMSLVPGGPITMPVSYNVATRYSGYGPDAGKVERIGGDSTSILGLNNAGQVIDSNGGQPVLTDGKNATPLGIQSGKGWGMAVNDAGQVLGSGFTGPDGSATGLAIWQAGHVTPLALLPSANWALGTALNNAGQATGYSASPDGTSHATLWDNGQVRDLGTLGGSRSFASGLNDAGTVVGWSDVTPSTWHAFVFKDGKMTDLGTLPGGYSSTAVAINAAGDIVGSSSAGTAGGHGFLYRNGQMLDLNTMISRDLGLTVTSAIDINALGQILATVHDERTGRGYTALLTPDGQPIPADPIPVPEPTVLAMAALLALAGGVRQARRRR